MSSPDKDLAQLDALFEKLSVLDANDVETLKDELPAVVDKLQKNELLLRNSENAADSKLLDPVWARVKRGAEICANAAKDESARTPIGESGSIELLVTFMKLSSPTHVEVTIQCLRALANLCFDHDVNRKRTSTTGAVSVIIGFVNTSNNANLVRTSCGALLNLGLNYEPIQSEILRLEGLPVLVKLLSSDRLNHQAVCLAARVINYLVGLDKGRLQFTKIEAIVSFVKVLEYSWQVDKSQDLDLMESVVDVLESTVLEEKADAIQHTVAKSGVFPLLLDFVESATPPKHADEDDQKQFNELRKTVVKITVAVTLTDSNMNLLYKDQTILGRFISWLRDDVFASRDDLHACAALSIGNLARNDEHCIDLVQKHHLEVPLLAILMRTNDMRTQHAVISIVKNLSLPKANKSLLGASGAIQAAARFLKESKDMLKPIQFGAVGVLKHLATGNFENASRMITGREPSDQSPSLTTTPLDRLIALVRRTDDMPTKSEGTRVLVNLVKVVWAQDVLTDILQPKDGISTAPLRRTLLKSDGVVPPIAEMIRTTQFPVLQNEGVMALTLLLASSKDEGGAVDTVFTSLTTTPAPPPLTEEEEEEEEEKEKDPKPKLPSKPLLDILTDIVMNVSGKYPDEIRFNPVKYLSIASDVRGKLESFANAGEASTMVMESVRQVMHNLH
ncbi:armadillo-type protein [Jimgerdemannia flammicorona]|uniref:Armadillo-type protein n=1 Tax=Jimgerdemannia flammicorona TaxID=994334 RepID=A0A433R0M6_9FUNG|nr:armadillo-type protein [Jimgerdemannia flammicorona]